MDPHCLVLDLVHPYQGREILKVLDQSAAGLLGNQLWPGP